MITLSNYKTDYRENVKRYDMTVDASAFIMERRRRLAKLVIRLSAAALLFAILFTGFALMQSSARGEKPAPPGAGEKVIIVSQGDTLWEIASGLRTNGEDIRRIVYDLKERNNLSSSVLIAGQSLIVPTD